MAVDAGGAPVTDRSAVDLALALARPFNGTLPASALTVTGPPTWRLLSVVRFRVTVWLKHGDCPAAERLLSVVR